MLKKNPFNIRLYSVAFAACFALILLTTAIYLERQERVLLKSKIQKIEEKVEESGNSLGQTKEAIEYTHMKAMIQSNYNSLYKNIIYESLTKPNLTPEDKVRIKSRLCRADVENSSDKHEIATAYICLSEIASLNNDVVESIRNLSYSIKAVKTDSNTLMMKKLIERGNEKEVSDTLKKQGYNEDTNWCLDHDQEMKVLNELLKSQDKTLSAKAAYRLNMIYTAGRTNEIFNNEFDLAKAFELQKMVKSNLDIKSENVIEIIFFFNDKYTKSALVTMASILANSSLHNNFRFTIVYNPEDPILPSSQEKLKNFASYRDYAVRFIPFPKEIEKKFHDYFAVKSDEDKYPNIGLMKGLVDSVVTDIDKALMLDTDLLILSDIGSLYSKDLGSNEYAASVTGGLNFKEGAITRHDSCEKLPSDYINAGVNFLNLKQLRNIGFSEKMYNAFLNDRCRNWWYHEQDLINIVLSGKISFISQRYNMVILTGYLEKHYPNGFMPFIIHFAGQKPWSETYLEKKDDYSDKPDAIKAYFPYLKFVEQYISTK